MKLQVSEIVLVRMLFHQAVGAKIRPAVVLLDTGDGDFVAAPITSQPRASAFDMVISDWQLAGLNVPSTARIHKPQSYPKQTSFVALGPLNGR
jgi:mRNA interferase MazF